MKYHAPVLLQEVIAHLKPKEGKKFIDATLGDGGHTLELLRAGSAVLGVDYNTESFERAIQRIRGENLEGKFVGAVGNFKNIDEIAKKHNFLDVDGILYDLGFSSFQVDDAELGLSFQKDQPLDMRLDKTLNVTAADLVNALSERELEQLIRDYSDERFAKRFAKAIVADRKLKKIQTTKELADILVGEASLAYEHGRIHPATRTFQALRIAVNSEIDNLELSLPRAARLLVPGGVLIIISFHSLEDRIAKKFGDSAQPVLEELYKKPIIPMDSELRDNVRSRSAKMRVYAKATS